MTVTIPEGEVKVQYPETENLIYGDELQEPISVVRVQFPLSMRLYAYQVRGSCAIGDQVLVDSPLSGVEQVPVVALGRGDYDGPLKMAMKI